MVEQYDPDQLAYTPESLRSRGVPPAPLPGEAWPLDNPRARSGYAPGTIRRVIPAEHQLSRFPDADGTVVRVDARVPLDSLVQAGGALLTALVVLDSTLQRADTVTGTLPAGADTVDFSHVMRMPAGAYVYSVELFEPESRYAARARYAIATPAESAALTLSDVVVSHPFDAVVPTDRDDPALRPLGALILAPDASVGLYIEVGGLRAGRDGAAGFQVEVTRHNADRASLPREMVNWLGRQLGLASSPTPPRVVWTEPGRPLGINTVAVDVALGGASPGHYVFEVTVTDLITGERVERRRPVRVR